MRIFGFNITKANPPQPLLPPTANNGWFDGWFNVIRESFPGAWQRNIEIRLDNVLTFSAVYSCVTLIASDMGKVGLCLVEQDKDGIWNEVEVAAFSPVLRKPNRYQTRQKFIEQWTTSKLVHGNTYVLKERDKRDVVVAMWFPIATGRKLTSHYCRSAPAAKSSSRKFPPCAMPTTPQILRYASALERPTCRHHPRAAPTVY